MVLPLFLLFHSACTPSATTDTGGKDTSGQEAIKAPVKKMDIRYHLLPMKDSGMAKLRSYPLSQQDIILAINRVDPEHAAQLDTLVVPDTFLDDFKQYSPFPFYLPFLKEVNKMVFFSYHAQAFAAYEHGRLVKWGPTCMGRERDQTPTGLSYANWKAEETQSTVDDEWILKWNVNIRNKEGIGWHQYAMPGYPASHSCLRMLEDDARFMYDWADPWVLKNDREIRAHGTPVMVFGKYPFGHGKPWYALAQNGKALDISADELRQLLEPHMQEILSEQKKLQEVESRK